MNIGENISLGPLNVYTDPSRFETVFPSPFYDILVYRDGPYKRLIVSIALAQWDPETLETFVLNDTTITLGLQVPTPLSLYGVGLPVDVVAPGSNITVLVDLGNIAPTSTPATVRVSLDGTKPATYQVMVSPGRNTFALDYTVPENAEAGSRNLVVELLDQQGNIIGLDSAILRILDVRFKLLSPGNVTIGEPVSVNAIVRNLNNKTLTANLYILVYGPNDVLVFEGGSSNVTVQPGKEVTLSIELDTSGWSYGNYTVVAWVRVWSSPERTYGPLSTVIQAIPPLVGGSIANPPSTNLPDHELVPIVAALSILLIVIAILIRKREN